MKRAKLLYELFLVVLVVVGAFSLAGLPLF